MSVSGDVLARLLAEATALHQGGRLDDAERVYQYILTLAPRHFDALLRLGIISMQRGLHTEALPRLDRALAVDPNSTRALFNRGTTLLALKRYQLAHDSFSAVLRLDPKDGDAHFSLGNVELACGRLAEALACYDAALELKPGDIAVIANRSSALARSGRAEGAIASVSAALEHAPADADLHYNHGLLARQLGRADDARASLERATALAPRHAQAHNTLGLVLLEAKLAEAALASFDRALSLGHLAAEYNRGLALMELKRPADALAAFERAITSGGDTPEAQVSRGQCLLDLGRHEEALTTFDALIAREPDNPDAHYGRGVATLRLNRINDSIACFERALEIDPDHVDSLVALAIRYIFKSRRDDAVRRLDRALELKPDFAAARLARTMAELQVIYGSTAEVEARRAAYARELDVLATAVTAKPDAFASAFDVISPFYLPYQGGNDRDLQSRYGALVCRAMATRVPAAALSPSPGAGEPIRVGFVSGFFRNHSNWNMPIGGWVKSLDRNRFQLFAYHVDDRADGVTAAARPLFARFVEGSRSVEDWAKEIASDRLHVLIYPEIGMSAAAWQLAALRLAPVQCNSWGHPTTSGYPTLDCFLSSDLMEPPEAQEHYSESLIRLPNLSVACEPIPAPPAPADRASLGLRPDGTVLWCAQSIFKHHPAHDPVLARIARAVPGCQMVFIEYAEAPELNAIFLERLGKAFAAEGLRASEHCVVLPGMSQDHYRAALAASDVFLDSLGWSGCNTILEALACDLPVVTMPGNLMRGRHGKAILEMIGLDEMIAWSIEDYVGTAARLANDPAYRSSIRDRIAAGKHRIYGDRAPIEALERFLSEAAVQPRTGR